MRRDRKTYLYAAGFLILAIACIWLLIKPDNDRPGDPAVYERIESSTTCDDLQGEFDAADARRKAALSRSNTALADINLSYMETASARMRQLGC